MANTTFTNASGSITTVSITGSLTNLDYPTGYTKYNITEVVIGTDVMSIGDNAFAYCTLLESVTIPESVTSIGVAGFHFCGSLTSMTIPPSVTSIGNGAFDFHGPDPDPPPVITITMNTHEINGTVYISPTINQSFFGSTVNIFVLPTPIPPTCSACRSRKSLWIRS
jgi:hypothetical protein